MSIREYASVRRWQSKGPILAGGTVYALVLSPSEDQHHPLIAGTPVGAFRSLSRGALWSWANRGLAGLQVSALACSSNGVLFLGTLDGSLARSVDGGYSWECMPGLQDCGSITGISVSPDYLKDGTILIGTESAGVFRSTDSGRTAKPVNFGLVELGVLCIACAPGWPTRSIAFAGTVDGLFRSTNGGRAWRPSGEDLEGLSIQAVSPSPDFTRDGTLFVGTEDDGLYRSTDGGDTFSAIGGDAMDQTVNALWVSPDYRKDHTLLVGSAGRGLLRSSDGGESWTPVLEVGHAVLAITGDRESIIAGFHGAGAYQSSDGGLTWEPCAEGLHANAFTQLALSGKTLFASGPDTGVFTSLDGESWSPIADLPDLAGLAALAVAPSSGTGPAMLLSDVERGLYLSEDGGGTWSQVLDESVSALCSAPTGGDIRFLGGTTDGRLLSTGNGQDYEVTAPFQGEAVLRLATSPDFASDGIVVAATRDAADGASPIAFWRSHDSGSTWTRLLEEEVNLLHVDLIADPAREGRITAVLDRYCLLEQDDGTWARLPLGMGDPPVLAIAARGSTSESYLMVGTTLGVFVSGQGAGWNPMMRGMGYAPVLAFAPANGDQDQAVWALALGGLIWKWDRRD